MPAFDVGLVQPSNARVPVDGTALYPLNSDYITYHIGDGFMSSRVCMSQKYAGLDNCSTFLLHECYPD